MIVAVLVVRVVQVSVDQVVGVVAVRHRFVAAVGTVLVILRVFRGVARRAIRGVLGIDRDLVLVLVVAVRMVQVAVVKVVGVACMLDGGVTAVGSVNVVTVIAVLWVGHKSPNDSTLVRTSGPLDFLSKAQVFSALETKRIHTCQRNNSIRRDHDFSHRCRLDLRVGVAIGQ